MVIKPVRLLCYMFLYTWRYTKFKSIPNILIVSDKWKRSVSLFHHNLPTKNKGLCTVREPPTKTTEPLFCLPPFITSLFYYKLCIKFSLKYSSRFCACSLVKLLFSNSLLILSVNNPTHVYLSDLSVYFKVEVYFRVTWSRMEDY